MEAEQKKSVFPIIAGVLFVLLALQQLSFFRFGFSPVSLLYVAGCVFFAVVLFMKRRDMLLLISVAVMAFLDLLSLLVGPYRISLVFLNLIKLAASLSLLAITAAATTDYFPQYKGTARQLWFLPLVLSAVLIVINLFSRVLFGTGQDIFRTLLMGAGYTLAVVWIAIPNGFSQKGYGVDMGAAPAGSSAPSGGFAPSAPYANYTAQADDGYCDMVKCILLLLFTFGIYYYIWIYRTTRYLNRVEGELPRNPTTKLLLCMFVPFYSIYWTYVSAQRVDKLARSRGVNSDLTVLCLVLAIFVGIIPPMLMQDKINTVVDVERGTARATPATPAAPVYTAPTAPAAPAASPAPQSTNLGTAAELKAYKELLDSGAITQEEFDAKKKQLLNL